MHEMYVCLQGEGKLVGIPHFLFRFNGCALRCRWCDTWYASWKPEKSKVPITFESIANLIGDNPQINHAIVSGGGPTKNGELLRELSHYLVKNGLYITLETEGSEFVQDVPIHLLSLSPKFASSTPYARRHSSFPELTISERDVQLHDTRRKNYEAMRSWIAVAEDYQVKPVIVSEEDLDELKDLQEILHIPNNKVWLMPEGQTRAELDKRRHYVMNLALEHGYNYSDRLHIVAFDNQRGV